MHADRINRGALIVAGVVLLVAGLAGLLAAAQVFGAAFAGRSLFDNPVSRFVGRNGAWLWPVVAVVALLVLLAVLRWLYALLLTTDRASTVVISRVRGIGRTELIPAALLAAVEAEINSYRDVDRVHARLLGDPDEPTLAVRVTVMADADISSVRHRVESGAFAHVREALDRPDLPILLDLDVSAAAAARVS